MRTILWALALGLVGVFSYVQLATLLDRGGDDKRVNAICQSEFFLRACKSYRHFPKENGKLPATLTDLVDPDPKSGRKPLVDGGKAALVDPWGQPYRYVVRETEAGTEAYVWAEWDYKGKLSIFGAKLAADGHIRMFNLPTD